MIKAVGRPVGVLIDDAGIGISVVVHRPAGDLARRVPAEADGEIVGRAGRRSRRAVGDHSGPRDRIEVNDGLASAAARSAHGLPAAAEIVVEVPGDVPVVAGVDRFADERQPARCIIVVMEDGAVRVSQRCPVAGEVVGRGDGAERAGLGQPPAERVPGEREGAAGLAGRGRATEVVVGVSDVGLGPGEVLERHPVELVEGERN